HAQLMPAALSSSPIVVPVCGGSCGLPRNGWDGGLIGFTAYSPQGRFATTHGQNLGSSPSSTKPGGVESRAAVRLPLAWTIECAASAGQRFAALQTGVAAAISH